ncbi:hypothetical protein ALC62_10699 [Cyphomyrmex costatus]|uniref:Uncharacterized protein n=1 Tax=Cyphomyrmex costatus TaxID=456900 RepID=A0A195CES9_9HYME|nr:hypothetical protein ALC62_10699 [Cyphomyrmex costatus]
MCLVQRRSCQRCTAFDFNYRRKRRHGARRAQIHRERSYIVRRQGIERGELVLF